MKKLSLSICVILLITASNTFGQLTPQPSSTETIMQGFGLGQIKLTYSRPNVKGRKIFGGMEPYGTVWRTGANSATVIKFTANMAFLAFPAKMNGRLLSVNNLNNGAPIAIKRPMIFYVSK
jgi:hypothetical protein